MTANVPTVSLNNGTSMPQLGLGVWQVPDDQAADAVLAALRDGYRSIDTAAIGSAPGLVDSWGLG
ncbi:hypothetical protein ODZ83_08220 [Acaricomes phytoseiuli]|uniref:hypothetical protein n=1 Tax=Acaricomes phytoseiuli TaxID=291968 RepID=UPI0003663392|nr:hypothetical protein [Acaricomes phytoseiuli]MCW1250162.1 hypothetical protein [Acaricomes phytoseiuli]